MSGTDERALAYADCLAREFDLPLVVLARSEAEQARAAKQAAGLITPLRIELVAAGATKLAHAFAAGLLVIGWHDIADYSALAEQAGCHIFITDEP